MIKLIINLAATFPVTFYGSNKSVFFTWLYLVLFLVFLWYNTALHDDKQDLLFHVTYIILYVTAVSRFFLFYVICWSIVGSIRLWVDRLVHYSHYAVISSWFIICVGMCDCVRENERVFVCHHVGVYCCVDRLFMDKLSLSCQKSPLWSSQESYFNELGQRFYKSAVESLICYYIKSSDSKLRSALFMIPNSHSATSR